MVADHALYDMALPYNNEFLAPLLEPDIQPNSIPAAAAPLPDADRVPERHV